MNTIQIQLTPQQYDDLKALADRGIEDLSYFLNTHISPGDYDDDEVAELERLNDEGGLAVQNALTQNKSYLWTSSRGDIELEIPADAVDEIAVPGNNEPACRRWLDQRSYLTKQLDEMDINKARHHLIEAGIDEVYKKSDADVRMYVLWMACHDIKEEENDNA